MHQIISGIYKIVNLKTNKFYIGSAKDINKRYYEQHLVKLRKNIHENIKLQRSYNKHGENNFSVEIIEICDKNQLFEREQFYLDTLKPYEKEIGYNIGMNACGGDNISMHPKLNEIKEKHSINGKKRWMNKTEEEKESHKIKYLGPQNPNWKDGSSKSNCIDCGVQVSPYKKRCLTCCKIGEKNPFYGKKHSKDVCEKLSEIKKGKKLSEETKRKCQQASINFYKSEEGKKFKKELSDRIKGKKHFLHGVGHTEKTKEKMKKIAKERIRNEPIKNKLLKKCKLNHSIFRYQDKYYLSYLFMSKDLNQSATTLRFKCRHASEKWKDYEEFRLNMNITKEKLDFFIKKIEENKANYK